MFAIRLVHLIEDHADSLSDGLLQRVKASPRCRELVRRVPGDELKRRTHEVYHHLNEWLVNKTEGHLDKRYRDLGMRRARQGIPFSDVFWGMCATKQQLWDYLQREGLLDGPVELWGEMELLHSLERFFDAALYFAALGYEQVREEQLDESSAAAAAGMPAH
jgi:hypothetical protein